MLDFSKKTPLKCVHCGKEKDNHRAVTFECPRGLKTRIGYTRFGPTTWEPKPQKGL